MPVDKPFRRTCRQFTSGGYQGGRWQTNYITHQKYSKSPQQYIRAFKLLQKDLLELFDYVEPSDTNLKCYSYRIHELLIRTCIEVEANCKAILTENDYKKAKNWNMEDYKKLNATHRLSSYQVKLPLWYGSQDIRSPFSLWTTGGTLPWYDAYNQAKHDRHQEFEQANFDNLLNAISGLVAILASQFHTQNFMPHDYLYSVVPVSNAVREDAWVLALGDYFFVKFPGDWVDADKYNFNWNQISQDADPF